MINKKRHVATLVTTFTALFAFAGCKKKEVTTAKGKTTKTTQKTTDDVKVEYTITFESNGGSSVNSATVKEGDFLSKPTNPTKNGFAFSGWFTDEELTTEFDFTKAINSDLKLYAKWEEKETTLTFETFGGTAIGPIKQKYGTTITAPANPEKAGYDFLGWYSDREFNHVFEFVTMPNDDLTIYAKFQVKSNTIAFECNGGSFIDPITQDAGTPITKPTDPIKVGYKFLGWFKDSSFNEEFIFDVMPNEGITLYANWEMINYTIVYHANEGVNPTTNPTTVNINNNANAIPLKPATRQDYDFVGWYLTEDFTVGTKIYNDEIPSIIDVYNGDSLVEYNENNELHLYARFKPHEYKITYVLYGATNTNPQTSNKENEAIHLDDPSKPNYEFLGWYTEASFDNKVEEIPAHLDHDITLYARFDYETYNITYWYCDDASSNPNPTTYNVDDEIIFNDPTKEGYIFKGWYSLNNFIDTYKITKIERGTTQKTFDVYAYFDPITYDITYADGNSYDNSTTYNIESQITLKNASKEGYTFDGWYKNGIFTEENKVTKIAKGTMGNINLTPKFTPITYTIKFTVDGGEAIDDMTYNIETATFTLPNATPTGDTPAFRYWKNGNQVISEIKKGSTGDLTLTAYFADEEYTVTFVNYDGTVLQEVVVGKNDEAVYTGATPVKPYTKLDLYVFSGWDTEITSITGNITAKAQFNEVRYLEFTKNSDSTAYIVKAVKGVELPEILELPTEYEEDGVTLPVTTIADSGFRNGSAQINTSKVKEIIIPEGYLVVNQHAFNNCTNVRYLSLPKSLKTIGTNAFVGMVYLEQLDYNCINLDNLTTSQAVFQRAGSSTENGMIINIGEDVTRLPNSLFDANTNVADYQVKIAEINFDGDSLKEIGVGTFRLTNVKEIILPDQIESIGNNAFAYIQNLEKIHLPKNLKTNGITILQSCNKLVEIELPYVGIKTDGARGNNYYFGNLFNNSTSTYANSSYVPSSLKRITLTNETAIPNYAFYYCQNVEEIILNEEITTIGTYSFEYCYRLKNLYYNCKNVSNLSGIPQVFYYSGSLTEEGFNVIFGKNVESIPAYLFYQPNNLDKSYWPKYNSFIFEDGCSCTTINTYAFYGVQNAKEFIIPDSVTSIKNNAFSFSGFETIYLNKTMETIDGNSVFSSMPYLKNVYINKKTINYAYSTFYNDNALKNVYYDGTFIDWMKNVYNGNAYANPMYYAKYFYIKVGDTYERITTIDLSDTTIETLNEGVFRGFETVTSIILPNTLKTIGDNVFNGMYRLKDITLPNVVEYIGNNAFSNCYSLKEITIPNSIKTIGDSAFSNCSNLISITFPDTLTELPSGLLASCTSMVEVTLPSALEEIPSNFFYNMTSLKTVNFPTNLRKINYQAFAYSGIENITIPNTVITLDTNVFSYTNNLVEVSFEENSKITRIPNYTFSHSGIKQITFPDSCLYINYEAFEYTDRLESIDFNNVEFIGSCAFQYSKIKNIIFNEGLKVIDSDAFSCCGELEEITIPKSLKYLGSEAFEYTYKLKKVNWNAIELPYNYYYNSGDNSYNYTNSNSGIFNYAGQNSTGIILNIGADVESLPYYFFYSYSSNSAAKLIEVNFPDNTSLKRLTNYINSSQEWSYSYAFGYVTSLSLIDIPGVEWIPAEFMYYTKNVDTIKINEGTKYLDYSSFYNMENVNNVYIPNSLEKVYSGVFYNTNIVNLYYNGSLEEFMNITYSNSSDSLLNYAENFYYKENGEYKKYDGEEIVIIDEDDIFDSSDTADIVYTDENPLVIPANIKKFSGNPFNEDKLVCKNIYFDGTLEDWCKIYFDYTNSNPMYYADHFYFKENGSYVEYTNLVIPSSITKINNNAFYGLKNVVSLDLNNVTIVGSYAFSYLGITSLDTKNVVSIGYDAFYSLKNMEELTLNEALKTIGDYAFYEASSLTSIVIPANVKTVGQGAFYYAKNLESITIEEGVEKIYGYAFYGVQKVKTITIPGTVKHINGYLFYETGFEEIILNEGVTTLYQYSFYGANNLKKVTIPGTVKVLPYQVFYPSNTSKLKEVILGEGVEEISNYAFNNCQVLEKVTLPSTITSIGQYAFYYCYQVNLDFSNLTNLKYIGQYAFEYCHCITDVVLPNSLESVGQYAFYNCNGLRSIEVNGTFDTVPYGLCYDCYGLNSIKLGENIQYIGDYAFEYCQDLFEFEINNNIKKIGNSAFYGCYKLYVIYNNSSIELTLGSSDNGYVAYYAKEILTPGENHGFLDVDGFIFTVDGSSYELISYQGIEENITLPKTFVGLNGETVTDYTIRSNAFNYNGRIKSVTIPDTFTEIFSSMFYNCRNLETVYIGSGVTKIGSNAFQYSGLKNIVIPNNVETIGSYAFHECRNLESITLGTGLTKLSDNLFYYCTSLENIVIPDNITEIGYETFAYSGIKTIDFGNGVTKLGYEAFERCFNLENIVIPENVVEFGDYLFSNCYNLKSFTILGENASISNDMFYECSGLEEVILTDNIVAIGSYAFRYCSSLRKVVLGANVKTIGSNAFYYCSDLKTIVFNDKLENIGDYAFCDTEIEEAILPNSVKTIGSYAFQYCYQLKTVKLSNQLTELSEYAFASCSRLDTVDFNGVVLTTIGKYAFSGCNKLLGLTLNEGLTYIGEYAFNNCIMPSDLVIPSTVTYIGDYAFNNCRNITKLSLGKGIKTLNYTAFNNCTSLNEVYYNIEDLDDYLSNYGLFIYTYPTNGIKLTIGKDVKRIGQYIFSGYSSSSTNYYPKFSEIIFEANSSLEEIGQYAFYYNKNELDIVLPNSCKTIGQYAFYDSGIKSIVMNGVETIDQYAFYYSQNLESVSMNNVITIGYQAFGSCSKITEVVIPESTTAIGNYAFRNCNKLEKVTINGNVAYIYTSYDYSPFFGLASLKEVVLGEAVTEVYDYLFRECKNLEKVTLSNNITNIKQHAFYNCYKLNDIELPSNLEVIGQYAFYSCKGLDKITLPATLTSIANYAFYECRGLYSVRNYSNLTINRNTSNGYVGNYSVEILVGDAESTLFIYDNKFIFTKESNEYYLVKYIGSGITDLTLPVPNTEGFVDPAEDQVIQKYRIRKYAFEGNKEIKKITIPNNINVIEEYAFSNISSLEEITIGEDVTSIGTNAFTELYNLKVINFNSTNLTTTNALFKYAGQNSDGVTLNIGENVKNIPAYFMGSSDQSDYNNITLVNFLGETSLLTIGNSAFCYCKNLESITIPDSVTAIGTSAFYYCTGLKHAKLSNSITVINQQLFYQCSNLLGIIIPANVTQIGNSAFTNCNKFNEVVLPSGITSIGASAFSNCSSLEVINLPIGLKTIGNSAFYYCKSLASIEMPNTVTSLGSSVFYYCEKLKTATLSQAITTINSQLFYNCYCLESIVIPDAVTQIGDNAFYGCSSLVSVNLPTELKTIGYNVFYNCSSLLSIHGYDKLITINSSAFSGCTSLQTCIFESDSLSLKYNAFYNCNNLETFEFNGNIKELGQSAFAYCSKLKEIHLGNELTSISTEAFRASGLESIVIPDTVTNIDTYAFYGCTSMTNITLSKSITVLKDYVLYNSGLEELIIPEGVTTISANSIYYLPYLKKLSLPTTLESIASKYFNQDQLEEVVIGAYFKDMTFSSDKINKVYVNNDEVAEYLLYEGSFGTLIKNTTEIYIKDGLVITDYVTDNYENSGTVTIDDTLYTKFIRK